MKQLLQPTMRHFGPKDPTPLSYLRQAGARGVVTALHHIGVGEVWSTAEIRKRQEEIENAGMQWTVVESLPVSEAIKTRGDAMERHLTNYVESLRNLAACGLSIVTYNFMPVMDWTRTDLDYYLPDGKSAIQFSLIELAVFDLYILQRPEADAAYDAATLAAAEKLYPQLDTDAVERITANIIKGLPGSEESFTMEEFRAALATYRDIDEERLRENLINFLRRVCPVAESLGIKLVIHPDDPPFQLLGLPRIMSTQADFARLIEEVPSPANGLCFCTGSLGVRPDNDLVGIAEAFRDRIHFIHLRSTKRNADGSFYEADHLEGDVPMREVVRVLLRENQTRTSPIPMRPDHGHRMLDDLDKEVSKINPGYPIIGRMKGLAELTGLQHGISV
ncbi:mannonate dehydratase [Lewinella sp. W8]|uniref:mannonate dehydratase n=1 Tax=Lewinella sp. W8 TaxID=2528208 RepID=UPI0010678D2D|nr:mannonate dehydratase [Lewinella sp. W8]MTB50415.1 mannonate dehydratase [Lewinella sp. W8]